MVLADAELTKPERQLVFAASIGELVDMRTGDAHLDHPSQAEKWDAARTVRADLLTELLTGRRQPGTGPVRAVKLAGARITGVLDLEAARLACPLLLDGCSVDRPISLKEAHAAATYRASPQANCIPKATWSSIAGSRPARRYACRERTSADGSTSVPLGSPAPAGGRSTPTASPWNRATPNQRRAAK
jgi:hypothetical protein